MPAPKLSVVIPAYNEADRLRLTLPQIVKHFRSKRYSKELIFVDDGSSDSTSAYIKKHAAKTNLIRLISHSKNRGKGAALRTGIIASKGKWVLFMDADLSTPLTELDRFWKYSHKYPVVIGSRKMAGAQVTRRQSFIRENLGKVFTFLTNHIATTGISDITCGFKLFQGKLARDLFTQSLLDDWSFDAEVLYLAQKYSQPIKQVPVAWQNDPRTKVNLLTDGVNSLAGLFRIRLHDLLGKYSPSPH